MCGGILLFRYGVLCESRMGVHMQDAIEGKRIGGGREEHLIVPLIDCQHFLATGAIKVNANRLWYF